MNATESDRWIYVYAAYGAAAALLCVYVAGLWWRWRRLPKPHTKEDRP